MVTMTVNMKIKYTSIFVTALVVMSGITLMSGSTTNFAIAKYANTQAQSIVNDCVGPNANCAVNSPQTQGDGGASTPMNLQISKFEEQIQEPEFPGGQGVPTVSVEKTVVCPSGFQCPGPSQFGLDIDTVPQASSISFGLPFNISPFTTLQDIVFIGATEFQFSIRINPSTLPPTPPGLTLELDTNTCSGTVDTTQSQNCEFSSRYIPEQPPQG